MFLCILLFNNNSVASNGTQNISYRFKQPNNTSVFPNITLESNSTGLKGSSPNNNDIAGIAVLVSIIGCCSLLKCFGKDPVTYTGPNKNSRGTRNPIHESGIPYSERE